TRKPLTCRIGSFVPADWQTNDGTSATIGMFAVTWSSPTFAPLIYCSTLVTPLTLKPSFTYVASASVVAALVAPTPPFSAENKSTPSSVTHCQPMWLSEALALDEMMPVSTSDSPANSSTLS